MDMNAVISVSALVACIQELVEDNFVDVLVQGELSNVSRAPSGHCYFTLKDQKYSNKRFNSLNLKKESRN